VEKEPLPVPLEDVASLLLFRTLQELLTNVVKHARAQKVRVSLKVRDDELTLKVRDDGRGFEVKANGSHWYRHLGFGLFSIRERISQLGCDLEVKSQPGQGTTVWVTLPLSRKNLVTH